METTIKKTDTATERVLYTAKTLTTGGGRDGGSSRSSDGNLDIHLSVPGKGESGTNPEQLFAAGWSACFIGAVRIVVGKMKLKFPEHASVNTEVDLLLKGDAYSLQARINVNLPGLDETVAQTIVDAAHTICPYSKAIHGNINVVTTVNTAL